MKLKTGDKVTVRNLLYGLMMRSGNDSAVALAEYVGRKCWGVCRKNEPKGFWA